MVKAKKEFCHFVGMTLVLITILSLTGVVVHVVNAEHYSFVYCYGNVKIWVSIVLNRTFFMGPNANSSIFLAVDLEELGNNVGVFINRLTVGFEGTQIREIVSPNATLNNNLRSWAYNLTFGEEDIYRILVPGQRLGSALNLEFRYDVIDPSGEYWSYRVNEYIPTTIQSSEQVAETWITFEGVFLIVAAFGVASAVIMLGLKIRRHKQVERRKVLSSLQKL